MNILERLHKERAQAKLELKDVLILEMTEEEFKELEFLAVLGNGGDVVNNGFKPDSPHPRVKIMVDGELRILSC